MGITNMKIIVTPCMVNIALNVFASRNVLLGTINCVRISIASVPPMQSSTSAVTPYRMPIRL